jgi:hypothetical protein
LAEPPLPSLIIILPTNFENHFLDKISLICIFGHKFSELQISWKPPNILSIRIFYPKNDFQNLLGV